MAFLGDKAVGSIVKLNISGVATDFIVVHQGLPSSKYDDSCNGTWLLMKDIYGTKAWDSTNNDYKNSDIHDYLNGTFLDLFDSNIKEAINQVQIPCRSALLSTKIFLLSGYEVGWTQSTSADFPIEGACLSYFSGTAEEDSKRIAYLDGSATIWWLRSYRVGYSKNVIFVNTAGGYGNLSCTVVYGIRPALILPSSLLVGEDGTVSTNTLPEITSDTPSGTDLGEISDAPAFSYSVSDEDGDAMTVSEYVNDTLTRSIDSPEGGEYTFGAVSGENWETILNGSHTLKIVANDGKANSNAYTVTFNKQKRTATVSLAEPLPADDVIKAAAIAVTGHFPEDSTLSVLVTNNALDDSPVWEDMTASVMNNSNHVFTNQTAENGFAFNFKVTAARGVSDEQGYISSIGGAFE